MSEQQSDHTAYWRTNIRIVIALLSIWFFVSYVLGILAVDWLNQFSLGGFPLGFWFAQQGSIYLFIVLVIVYAVWMEKVDKQFGVNDEEGE